VSTIHQSIHSWRQLWTTTHLRPKPCFALLQSSAGLAVRPAVSRLRQEGEAAAAQEAVLQLQREGGGAGAGAGGGGLPGSSSPSSFGLVLVRFFSKLNNIYCAEPRTDAWCYVHTADLHPFCVPPDHNKSDSLMFAKAIAEKVECQSAVDNWRCAHVLDGSEAPLRGTGLGR
jgi:hypothetical protein